jgi:hypothetical protein
MRSPALQSFTSSEFTLFHTTRCFLFVAVTADFHHFSSTLLLLTTTITSPSPASHPIIIDHVLHVVLLPRSSTTTFHRLYHLHVTRCYGCRSNPFFAFFTNQPTSHLISLQRTTGTTHHFI